VRPSELVGEAAAAEAEAVKADPAAGAGDDDVDAGVACAVAEAKVGIAKANCDSGLRPSGGTTMSGSHDAGGSMKCGGMQLKGSGVMLPLAERSACTTDTNCEECTRGGTLLE